MKAEHGGTSPDLSRKPGFSEWGPIQLVPKSQLQRSGPLGTCHTLQSDLTTIEIDVPEI